MSKAPGKRWLMRGSDLRALVVLTIVLTCVNALRPTASYRVLELGGAAAAVGVVASAYALLPALVAIPLGRFIDRSGRQVLPAGLLLVAVGSTLCGLSDRVSVLAMSQAVAGLGQLVTAISVQTIAAERDNLDLDRGFAQVAIAASAGQLLGPLAAGAVLGSTTEVGGTSSTTLVFVACCALALVALPVALKVKKPRRSRGVAVERRASLKAIALVRGMPQALATSVAVLVTVDLIVAYLPLIGEARGVSPGAIGVLLSLRALSGLASRVAMPRLISSFGRRSVLLISTGGAAVGMFALASLGSAWALAAAMCFVGFGLGIGTPMTMAWTALFAPEGAKSTAMALRITSNRVGQVVAPLVFGLFAAALGPGAVFAGSGSVLISGVVWLGFTLEESALT